MKFGQLIKYRVKYIFPQKSSRAVFIKNEKEFLTWDLRVFEVNKNKFNQR